MMKHKIIYSIQPSNRDWSVRLEGEVSRKDLIKDIFRLIKALFTGRPILSVYKNKIEEKLEDHRTFKKVGTIVFKKQDGD